MTDKRFELADGTIFESNEKGNYFYKSTGRTDKKGNPVMMRVSRAVYEQAFEEMITESADQAKADAEYQARKDLQEAKDREDEANYEAATRKPKGTDLKVPAVLNQYRCVDCSKCNVQNCVHRDCMRRNPTSEGGLAECPRLKVKAEEPKKTRKPRRSKDIAYTGTSFTLTAKQVDFIRHIPDTCFYENGLDSTVWCDILADEIGGQFAGKPMTVGAMISTLREKGLLCVMTGSRDRKCKYFEFTEVGKEVAKDLGLH